MDPERIWDRVSKDSHLHPTLGACWVWTGAKTPGGYGRVHVRNAYMYPHRIAWELSFGPIPRGMFVCHHCDNPPCCNPAHLFLGTAKDNANDRESKGRGSHVGLIEANMRAPKGSERTSAKVTDDDVRSIRRMRADGATLNGIANAFAISRTLVAGIVKRTAWRHVE